MNPVTYTETTSKQPHIETHEAMFFTERYRKEQWFHS